MPTDFLKSERRWIVIIPVAIIVVSVVVWFVTRETLPKKIRIATAQDGGLYHEFGEALQKSLEERTGRKVELIQTEGSVENAKLLREGEADVAIVQGGSSSFDDLSVIAPLYPEVVHILARGNLSLDSVVDLKSHRVVFGSSGSGMRASAERLLEHYGILGEVTDSSDVYFKGLLEREEIDGAIVTTGFMNSDLQGVLSTGEFKLLPIESAEAVATKDPFFQVSRIPRGLYREGNSIPPKDVPTVSTMAFLVVQDYESELLIRAVMEAIYDEGLEMEFPTLISRNDVLSRSPVALHAESRGFFNPPDRIGQLAKVIETLAAFKELSIALVAGLYLVWKRRKSQREVKEADYVQMQKDHLDSFLEKTLVIERAQMDTVNVDELQGFLDQVTEIKLEALTQLTHEELRSDQAFSIFILQCGNLISKIQMKILNCPSP
ncbi:MAG: TAXI family TRAP transporter solute-binding subunit [Akkermansiaceae bacterium]|nr:TAXI family TRAP transporter solute-binding subunit [Akkermansiaceae bacterium]